MVDYDICPSWVRPCEWPGLPSIADDEERVVGLVAVEDTDSEFLAVLCEGDYIIDWGDASEPELVASGVKAEHQYVYASIPWDPVCASPSSSDYDGYKVVTVSISPQPGDSASTWPNLTKVDLQQRHSAVGTNSHAAKWLELDLSLPNCVSLSLGPSITPGAVGDEYLIIACAHFGWLQSFTLRRSQLTSLSGLLAYSAQLKKVTLLGTENVTDVSGLFYRCSSLIKVDWFDTSSVTTMYRMFGCCFALKCVPALITSSVTDMSYMFYSCWSLPEVPLLDTSAALTMEGMFKNCWVLSEIPAFVTSAVTTMKQMCYACESLRAFPLLDTSAVSTMREMLSGCLRLRQVAAIDTSAVTDIYRLFRFCRSLSHLPPLDFSAVSSTSNATDYVAVAEMLTRIRCSGLRYSHSYLGRSLVVNTRPLTAAALDEIFTNLGTAVGAQTVNITGCIGASTCDRTIATAKGWTVIG